MSTLASEATVLCECGCGTRAPALTATGERRRFIHGHNGRGAYTTEKPVVRDCGYDTSCWVWSGCVNDAGYGHLRRDGRFQYAHRHFYEEKYGPIPNGLVIDHLCHNRACVNPDHLEPVTSKENARRGLNFTGSCRGYGHEYTEENTYFRSDTGTRQCRTCIRHRRQVSAQLHIQRELA